MNANKATGLGEPEPIGKKSLFQPPRVPKAPDLPPKKLPEKEKVEIAPERIRMTLEVTKKSLAIMQDIQSKHRLETGRPLQKWKVISAALEVYEKAQKGEGSEKSK